MLRVACVTTFSDKIYSDYAHRMMDSYCWPFDLYVYSEDFTKYVYNHKVTENRNLFEVDPECKKFVDRNLSREHSNVVRGNSMYYLAGVRFCYKVFAVTHFGLNETKYDRVIFFDADVIFTGELIDSTFVRDMLCGDHDLMSYFGRNFWHSETGFLVFNLNHQHCMEYLTTVRDVYVTDDLYSGRIKSDVSGQGIIETYTDSAVYDTIRSEFQSKYNRSAGFKDLSSDSDRKHSHPMATSFMNEYFDHQKGKRIKLEHSPEWLKARNN